MDEQHLSRSILNIRNLAVMAIFGLMIWFVIIVRGVIGIFLISMVLAFLFYPVIDRLHAMKIPRSLAILLVYFVFFLTIGVFMLVVGPPLIEQTRALSGSESTGSIIDKINAWLINLENSINAKFSTSLKIRDLMMIDKEKATQLISQVFSGAKTIAGGVASFVTALVSIPVISFYILMDWPKIKTSLLKFLPPNIEESSINIMKRLSKTLNSYLRGQIKLSCMMFILTTVPLMLLNAIGSLFTGYGFYIGPFLILGMLAGLLEVIPIVGPLIAFLPAVILGFMHNTATGITVVLLYGLIQWVEGNLLVPRIMGQKLNVHPLTVMFALLCGGLLGGIVGMLLALPIAATLKVVFEQYYSEFILKVENLLLEQNKQTSPRSE
jgi:predicted PurR-regulated permease PerM